ncbi:heparan-sulfate 6-O-sulfotransferase 2-like [Symsagittifera roscoffensis]|uniref:heparan-sulfate 6-O-sulfotransferase 2-like n=1 Tax=Symsagittifera roscoffensis TaxID=84072 RepID=UPI00307C0C86
MTRFFYVSVLRDPLTKFLSEWRHVQRSATWKRSNHMCNSQPHEIRSCYEGEEWSGVSLDEFISYRWNLAFNRQTRMLADLSLVNCYEFITYQYNTTNLNSLSSPDRERLKVLEHTMLESSKSNLKRLAFLAILGRSSESHSLISASLGLHFHEGAFGTRTPKSGIVQLEDGVRKRILMLNYLDSELFNFATAIFNERLKLLETS